ncbi:protein translocase subunit SecF [Ectothiorhodospiraceae bacterium BW-2]|nr:protein translocase subunit SecF [Ectothiorhodospiraceae bacterium BW-2]
MQILTETRIDFMSRRRQASLFSVAVLLIALAALLFRSLNFGIDFTGGTLIEVGYSTSADLEQVRQQLSEQGFDEAVVQHFGSASEVLIRIPPQEQLSSAAASDQIVRALKLTDESVELRRQEFVGPQVGEELTEDGGLAMIYALIGILIYVALRFEYRFAFGAIIALVHDVVIVLGVFALLQLEFDLTVLAAILAVIGYSLNDTIVVFDRIRENFLLLRKGSSEEVINRSLNDTLSRTLMTSLTTLLVLLALFMLGGELIHAFASALIIGVLVGTYSSIYVASSAILALGISREDLMPPEREGADIDGMP